MSKIFCFDRIFDTALRNKQIIYLHEFQNMNEWQIAQVVGLAPSTVKSYIRKYDYYIDEVETLFTDKISKSYPTIYMPLYNLEFAETKATQKFYLLEIREFSTGKLIASKVGTTVQKMSERAKDHRRYYTNSYGESVNIEVKRVYDCGDIPAECYESFFRAYYIARYSKKFAKNDRFNDVFFDYDEADKLFYKWKKDMGI